MSSQLTIRHQTPMQTGMLVESRRAANAWVYVQQVVCRVERAVDLGAFEKAWHHVIRRHGMLRTHFEFTEAPVQVEHSAARLDWQRHDWRHLTSERQADALDEYLSKDRDKGIDVERPPLMRVSLFILSESSHAFIWTYHHAIVDGRSRVIVLNEFFTSYQAYERRRQPDLPPARPYSEFLDWRAARQWTDGEKRWRDTFRGFESPTSLVSSIGAVERPTRVPFTSHRVDVDANIGRQLESLAETHSLSINTVVQGAWALLLGAYTNSTDVAFGATWAGRRGNCDGAEAMVGLLINTLPVRVELPPSMTALQMLERLRSQHLAMRAHQQTPLGQVVVWIGLPAARPPFDTLVVFERSDINAALAESGVDVNADISRIGYTHYPLTLFGYARPHLRLELHYDCRWLDEPTISRLSRNFGSLLRSIAPTPETRLADLPLMREEERQQVVVTWNQTHHERNRAACVHTLVETQTARTPKKPAVISDRSEVAYEELNRRANQLAHHLLTLGLDDDACVGVYLGRTERLVLALLGIMKAGYAWVPLDPAYPIDRLRFILADSGMQAIITEADLSERVRDECSDVICLDRDGPRLSEGDGENPGVPVSPRDAAYIIYTSGSTGRPKAVVIEHRNAVAFLDWATRRFSIADLAGVFASTSICFDLSVFELFAPLACGGTTIIGRDALALWDLPAADRITLVNTVPSAMAELLHFGPLPPAIQTVNLAGEPLAQKLVQDIYRSSHVREVLNLYGPSETTTYSTCATISRDSTDVPAIGRPIDNTRVYLLDQHGRPVPIGAVGELYIGGTGVARGYRNRPDITSERFVPDPFQGDGLLYRTGDLARYRPDGALEFLGRADTQVKIRGYRIELGEIEAVLREHPTVDEAVVLAQDEGDGVKRLVAHVAVEPELRPTVRELRSFIRQRLPDYMVPSLFAVVDALPRTPNGKVNRLALRAVAVTRAPDDVYVEPTTAAERTLAAIWQDVLKIPRIGIHDNFFELGGDSLLAMRMVARACRQGMTLHLSEVFRCHTVSELASRLAMAQV